MSDVLPRHLKPRSTSTDEAHTLLREIEQTVRLGAFVWQPDEAPVWSPGLFRVLGLDPADDRVVAGSFYALVHPEDLSSVQATWERVLRTGHTPPLTYRIVRPDGDVRWIEGRCAATLGRDGRVIRVLGTMEDVTERQALEEQLQHAAKMEAIGTLAAGIAHDFNNYLAVVTMHLDALSETSTQAAPATIEGARHAAEQCAELTRQLLTFARKQHTELRAVDVGSLVRKAAQLVTRFVGPAIAVSLDIEGAPLRVHADATQLESALVNLAANARDAMPAGGQLAIAVRRAQLAADDPRLDSASRPGCYALIRVADSGVGIAAANLPRIFEPYFTTKELGHGTGLGLAMVYGSVRQHHGFVRVESVLGQGTTFEVYLPCMEDAPRDTAAASPAARTELTGRVLVVEDVHALRELAMQVLRGVGLTCVGAEDGVAALALVREARQPFDVIVTDLTMPHMSGTELAREIARSCPSARFVFMSGYLEPSARKALREAHPKSALLAKPFRARELIDSVAALLSRSNAGG